MAKIFLAEYYGTEGWVLTEYATADAAFAAVIEGRTNSSKWKILKELNVTVEE